LTEWQIYSTTVKATITTRYALHI